MLTAIQKGLLAESLIAADRGINVEQVVWELDFVPAAAQFRAAFQHVIESCDALRLGFSWPQTAQEPVQRVHERVTLPFRELDYSAVPGPEQQTQLERFLEQDRSDGFDLLSVPLTRASLIVLGPERAVCVWTIHHSIIDGRSFALVLQRVATRYASGKPQAFTPSDSPPSFVEFLRWHARRDTALGAKHFATLLHGFSEATPLPLQQDATRSPAGKTLRVQLRVDAETSELLRRAAHATRATPNTFVQLAWAILLANYSGQSDVVFGSTWSGRAGTIEDAEQVVGPFISTLPVRVRLAEATTIRGLIAALRAQHVALRPFTHTSLAEIKTASDLVGAPQLFRSLVVFDHHSLQADLEGTHPSWKRWRVWSRSQAGYPLVLAARFEGDELELELEVDVGLYDGQRATRLLADYARVLANICAQLDESAFAAQMLEPRLQMALTTLEAERGLATAHPVAIARILDRARQCPSATAIRQLDGEQISYAELERRVRHLAAILRENGVGPGVLVAIWLPRTIAVVVALLAVHAAGGALVPLDTHSPVQRVEHVLGDSKAALLLVNATTRGRLQRADLRVLDVDQLAHLQPGSLEIVLPDPASPAYVIYTSGSTGLPKGVVVPHSALANHLAAILELFSLTPDDRVLQFATPTFDVALEEVLPTLAAGATLVLRDEAMASTARVFFEVVTAEHLSVVNLPTAFWHQLVHGEHLQWPACLRLVVVGGERASAESLRRFRQAGSSHARWLNAYGPTEATITSTVYDDAEGDHGPDGVPIGRALSGVSHFVLDERMRPVPPGSVGQLYIGGAGLALGYLFRDELTAERFVSHPWLAGARLYMTGDRVRQTVAGNYVFIDRPDNQVKLRGFRIELGEIEAQLRRHPAVSEAAVIVRMRNADRHLVGFVISEDAELSELALREHLSVALPAYMLPTRIVVLPSLPMTLSGKVDRHALAEVPLDLPERASVPPPSTSTEHGASLPILLDIWSEVLGSRVTDTSASFFDLGGHSLLVVRMFSELEQRLGRTCNVAEFFRNPTVVHLAELLRDTAPGQRASVMRLAPGVPGARPLFFAPGLTGRAVDFVHLVDAISASIPVYALQLHAFGGDDDPSESLSDAVKAVVTLMLQVQQRGPYAIAGFSAGGVFAVAIAEELAARGERCDFVGLIDSVPPASVPMLSPFTSPRRLLRLSRTVFGRVREIVERTRSISQLLLRATAAAQRSLARWHSKYQPTIEELLGQVPVTFSRRDVETMQRYLDATVDHRFGQLSVDIVLFRVPLDPPEGPYEQDLDWSRVTQGKVFVEQMHGRHGDLMTSAGCRELAALMDSHLQPSR
ncbi:MAG: amino acid adenylation domain-containing protein [Pseudomonadota bacterium]